MARSRDYDVKGERVRALRVRKMHMTQQELADAAGMSHSHISRIEAGLNQPQIGTLKRLAGVLGVEIDEIVTWNVEEI